MLNLIFLILDVCKECGHLVSQHFYSFRIVGPKQEYFMDCNLCGKAEDSQWILNEDAMKDIHPEHISQLERGDLGEEEGGEIVINEIDAARLIELVNLNAIPSEGENPCAEGEVDSDWE